MRGDRKSRLFAWTLILSLGVAGISAGCQSETSEPEAKEDSANEIDATSFPVPSSESSTASSLQSFLNKQQGESDAGISEGSTTDLPNALTDSGEKVAPSILSAQTDTTGAAESQRTSEASSDASPTPTAKAADVDANRLLGRIAQLTEVQRTAETKEQIRDTLVEQADLAKQIYESSSSFSFKVAAVKTRVHALTILDKMQEPEAFESLLEFGDSLMERPESELRKMGFFASVSARLRQYLMDPQSQDFEEIVARVDQFTGQNFDDFDLGTELAAAGSQLFIAGKREEAIQLMSVLRDNFRKSSRIEMVGVADTLAAQVAMASVKLDKVIAGQIANEDKNLPQLADAMDQMLASGVTVAFYNEMTGWMQMFEREARYRSVDLVAEKMQQAFREAAQTQPDKFLDVLDSLELVRKRMALIGKPLSFQGVQLASGKPFDPSVNQGKVVLVTFWTSKADQNERLQLQFETRSYEDWRPMGVSMVGFNMDDDPDAAAKFFGTTPPRWHNTRSDDPSELGYDSEFANRCVADQTPYRVLLDRDGKVAHVAVPVDRLAARVSELLQGKPAEPGQETSSEEVPDDAAADPAESDGAGDRVDGVPNPLL